jgi:peptide/nickel transport system ATP-binding protein
MHSPSAAIDRSANPLVRVEDLSAEFERGGGWHTVVSHVSLTVAPGEILGLAGESGSGKSTLAYALLGYSRVGGRIEGGSVAIAGRDVTTLTRRALQDLRGGTIGYVSQHPSAALTRNLRVGSQIRETLRQHGWAGEAIDRRAVEVLGEVGIPDPEAAIKRYPHQFSGGQQQRIAIAIALAGAPSLIVLDEPTTGLDVTTTRRVIELLRGVRASEQVAMVYVTHDLRVLARLCDRIAVMHRGAVVETGSCAEVLDKPAHPYTIELISSVPTISRPPNRIVMSSSQVAEGWPAGGCTFASRCIGAEPECGRPQGLQRISAEHDAACWKWSTVAAQIPAARVSSGTELEPPPASRPDAGDAQLRVDRLTCGYGNGRVWRRRVVPVVEQVSFEISAGETVALVGESGAGKSTIARAVVGLHAPISGTMTWGGQQLGSHRALSVRREIQIVFQNPDQSLNPRATVESVLRRPLELYFALDEAARRRRIDELLTEVNLPVEFARRFTFQLSGGEKQRVAIARALAAKPSLLVCDEVLSSLDVSLQGSILALLRRLQREQGLGYLFITHDLAVARWLATRIVVLRHGSVCEVAAPAALFAAPQHEYTRALVQAARWYDVGTDPEHDPTPAPHVVAGKATR